MKKIFLLLILVLSIKCSISQTSYVWNGTTSTNWGTNTNWTPNGIPGSADNVTIVTGANNCILAGNTTITNLTITSGVLNLNAFTLNTTGVVACNGGSCTNGTFNSTATALTFAGTTFGANITANVTEVYFNGSTFNGSVTVSKSGGTNAQSNGNNVFNGVTSITNAGTGYLLLTNGGVGRNETFNAATTFATSNTGALYIGYTRDVALNANVTINNTSTGNIQIGRVGVVTVNTGVGITCGTFTGATLNLFNLNQSGTTALNLSPGAAAVVNIYGSTLTGSLNVNAGLITAQTSTFAAAVTYSVSGTINNAWSNGGNVYNGILRVYNSSNGFTGFANGTADTYNADVYATNTSTTGGRIIFGNNCTSQFNGDIYVSQSGTTAASGIALGWSGTFPVINLAAGKNILVNGAFSSGYLQLLKLQTAGATNINLVTTGTSAVTLNNNIFNGNVTVSSPDIYPLGGTYNGPVIFTKTGGGSGNHNNGNQNIFNSTLEVNNQNGGGYIILSLNSADQFNDNITVTSTGTATGISFGWSGGSGAPVLAAGKTISIGAAGYSSGYLQLGSFTQLGSAPINLNLTGTANFQIIRPTIVSTIGGAINVTAPDIYIQGATFNGAAVFTKTGGGSNHNNGNQNIFNSTCTINQQSTGGYFMLGYNSNDLFNDDITVTNTGTQGIYLGFSSGSGTPTLASGKTINIGGAGFSGGFLHFGTFTQLGSAPINLPITGATTTVYFRSSVFGGDITTTSPSFYFSGSTFNGSLSATKTGSAGDASPGGNTFNGVSTFINNSAGYYGFGWTNPDIWNNDVTFTNNGSERILPCYVATGNQFNGNITLNCTGSSTGINFCGGNVAATATLAATKSITVGSGGYTSGYLLFQRFTALGTAPINLPLTTTANYIQFGPSSTFGGNITSTSPGLFFNTSTFNGTVSSLKTGASYDASPGGNTFNAACSYTNAGTGYLMMGNGLPDTWNGDVDFVNTGSERILPCWNSTGNIFNGNINFTSTGSSTGIHFCGNAAATATMTAGHTISTPLFDKGYLILTRFTQLGSGVVTLSLTSTANYLQYGPASTLGGNVTSTSPTLYFNGCTFNGTTDCIKTGATGDYSNGGNIFNGVSTITNNGTNYLLMGNTSPDIWNNDVTFTNNSNERILPAWATVGNQFNGNIYVNTTGSAQGIQFCGGNATATATLAATKTIAAGSLGLNAGYLILKQFTQLGNAPINLTLSSTATYLQYGPLSALGGNVTSVSPRLFFNGCNFSGTTNCTKNGAQSDAGSGTNIFNGDAVMTNSGSGYLMFGNGNSDQFMSTSTFNNTGSDHIYVAYNSANNVFGGTITLNNTPTSTNSWIQVAGNTVSNSTFNGNIVVTNVNGAGIYFGNGPGTSTLTTGRTITIGAGGFNSGRLVMRNFTQVGGTAQSLTTTGTSIIEYGPSAAFGGNVTSVSPRVYFNGCNFSGTTNCTKNGAIDDDSNGANTFTGASTITNTGSGRILMGNASTDAFMSTATFNNNGSANMYLAHNSASNTFGGVTTFNNAPTSTSAVIYVSGYSAGTVFSDNVVVTNVNGGGVQFCYGNATANATLSSGKTITIGGAGFNSGTLLLKQFIQLGATPQSFTTTGTASIIQYGPGSAFGGNVSSASPRLYFNGCTFSGSATCTKNGAVDDASSGNNIFNGPAIMTNSGSGYLMFGNGNADQFNSTSTFNNTGSYHMYIAYNSPNNIFGGVATFNNTPTNAASTIQIATNNVNTATFNDNIVVTSVNSAGVYFGNGVGTTTLSAGKTITIGAGGFNSGQLLLRNFTQLSATPQTLNILAGTGSLVLGPASTFNGTTNFNFPQVYLNGTTYNSAATIQKNGATDNAGTGGNIFNGTTIITNSGSGYLLTGNGTADQFNGLTTINNTGSYRIYFAHNHAGQTTTFTQPTILNGAKTGGADAWTYLIAESNNSNVSFNDLTINISGTLQSNYRILNGTGGTATYNGNLIVNLTNTNASGTQIQLGNSGTSVYNGNVSLISTTGVAGSGIFFNTAAAASSTMAATKAISLGVGGFTSGTLSMIRFTQLGTAVQTLSQLTGTGILISGPANTFNGDVAFNFPQLYLNGGTYNGVSTFQKNGATDNACVGANIFNGATTITNSHATNYLRLAATTADNYNGDVTLVQNGAGILAPNYNTNCTYSGNVTVSSSGTFTITFGSAAAGIATFNGGNAQTINKSGTVGNPVFTRLVANKSANDITLNTRVNVSASLTLTNGIFNTTAANILNMNDLSTTTIGNAASYINGPMNYDMALNGTRTLNFPIGKTGDWRPATLVAAHNNATSFTYNAELTNSSANALGWTKPATVNLTSLVHYWDINRSTTSTGVAAPATNVSGNQTITFYYGNNDGVTDPTFLTLVKNTSVAPTTWFDIGGTGATAGAGSVTSSSAPTAFTSYSRFTLANRNGGTNPLPIELLYFTAKPVEKTVSLDWATATEAGNDHFDIERSIDGINFEYVTSVKAYGNGNSLTKQVYNTIDPKPYKGISYYRLKQVDQNTTFKYADVVSVEFTSTSYVNIFPNPASSVLTVKASDDYDNAAIKIINNLGVEVIVDAPLNSYNGTIDLSHLASGIYYVVIQNGENMENIKISVQK